MNWDNDLDALATCALNRMDEKGESLEAAAEAVTGGNPELMAAVIRDLRGEPRKEGV